MVNYPSSGKGKYSLFSCSNEPVDLTPIPPLFGSVGPGKKISKELEKETEELLELLINTDYFFE